MMNKYFRNWLAKHRGLQIIYEKLIGLWEYYGHKITAYFSLSVTIISAIFSPSSQTPTDSQTPVYECRIDSTEENVVTINEVEELTKKDQIRAEMLDLLSCIIESDFDGPIANDLSSQLERLADNTTMIAGVTIIDMDDLRPVLNDTNLVVGELYGLVIRSVKPFDIPQLYGQDASIDISVIVENDLTLAPELLNPIKSNCVLCPILPQKPGEETIRIDFSYQLHWLAQVKIEFNNLEDTDRDRDSSDSIHNLQRTLEKVKQALANLEEQAVGFPSLAIPTHLQVGLEVKKL